MALPKLDVPIYQLTLPSNNREISYRPFLVKEEKILLMAMEGEDQLEMINGIKQIITNCVSEEINVDNLPVFDLEYIFLNLRTKSIGAESVVGLSCPDCNTSNQMSIDLEQVTIEKSENHSNEINLTDTIGISMKYPTVNILKSIDPSGDMNVEDTMNMIQDCVGFIWNGDDTHDMADYNKDEKEEFFEGLTQGQFADIQSFFETMPKLSHNVDYNCRSCDYDDTIKVEGLQNFFG